MGLHSTFAHCIAFVIVGQVIRRLAVRKPENMTVLSKMTIQVIIPCLMVRTLSKMHTIPFDGVIFAGAFLLQAAVSMAGAFLMFRNMDLSRRASLITGSFCLNIGVFMYPIIEEIAGSEGVAMSALLDFPNTILLFTSYPLIYGMDQRKLKAASVPTTEIVDPDPVVSAVAFTAASASDDLEMERISSVASEAGKTKGKVSPAPSPHHDTQQSAPHALIAVEVTAEPHIAEEKASLTGKGKDEQKATAEADKATPTLRKWSNRVASRIPPWVKKAWVLVKPVVTSLPIIGLAVGVILGVGFKVTLPPFIDALLEKVTRSNSFVGMTLIGMLLDLSPASLKKHYRVCLAVMGFRYVVGGAFGAAAYFLLGPYVQSPVGKTLLAWGFILPTPLVCATFALEHGFDASLAALIANCTLVVSFFLLWGIMTVLPIAPAAAAASSVASSIASLPSAGVW